MNEPHFGLFLALICAALVWFILCHRMFGILQTRQPQRYAEMGKPSLIKNNSLSNNLAFLKFLLRRDWKTLDDEGVALLGNTLLVLFAACSILFGYLVFVVLSASIA